MISGTKCCTRCTKEKEVDNFYKGRADCKICYLTSRREYSKKYKKENKEKIRNSNKEYKEENKKYLAKCSQQYKKKNKEKILRYNKEYKEENKEDLSKYAKEYKKENKEKISIAYRFRKYGLTDEAFRKMLSVQNNLCYICGLPFTTGKHKLTIDHDHATGKVRKLLHSQCNLLLGVLENNRDLLVKIQIYLKEHTECQQEE